MRFLPKVLLGAWVIALLPLAGVGWVLTREMAPIVSSERLGGSGELARRTVDSVRQRMDRAVDQLTLPGTHERPDQARRRTSPGGRHGQFPFFHGSLGL
jgi:hypothetical protein